MSFLTCYQAMDFQIRPDLSKSGQLLIGIKGSLIFTLAELLLEKYKEQLFSKNIELKAIA